MEFDWVERQILATCLLLGIRAGQGDRSVTEANWRLAVKLGVDKDMAALAAERVRLLREKN